MSGISGACPETETFSDDSISLTSTALSDGQGQYYIDGGILAERMNDGEVQYLVKWAGYDEHRNTWEPVENFTSSKTIANWRKKKARIAKGLDKPFDMDAHDERVLKIMEKTAERKQRRRLKRARVTQKSNLPSEAIAAEHSGSDGSLHNSVATRPSFGNNPVRLHPKNYLRRPWTDQEGRMLEAGLIKVKGPFWNRILELYGPDGTINHDLKQMNERDLYEEAFRLKTRYIELKRDVPFWLVPVMNEDEDRSPASKDDQVHASTSHIAERDRILAAGGFSESYGSQLANKTSLQKDSNVREPMKGQISSPRRDSSAEKVSQEPPNPNLQLTGQVDTQQGPPGSSSASIRRSIEPKRPTQFKIPKRSAKTGTSVLAVTNLQSLKDKRHGAEPFKLFKNLSTQNRVSKERSNEPAPSAASLILFDPKTGKVPESSSVTPIPESDSRETTVTATQPVSEPPGEGYEEPREDDLFLPSTSQKNAHNRRAESPHEQMNTNEVSKANDIMEIDDKHPHLEASETITGPSPGNHDPKPFDPPTEPSAMRKKGGSSSAKGLDDITLASPSSEFSEMIFVGPQSGKATTSRNPSDAGTDTHRSESLQVKLLVTDKVSKQKLLSVKWPSASVQFKLDCKILAAEYQTYFPLKHSDLLGWGFIEPLANSQERIDWLAVQLDQSLSGALCITEPFTMVLFPAGSESWAFLEHEMPDAPEGVKLRFAVRNPLNASNEDRKLVNFSNEMALRPPAGYEHIVSNGSDKTHNGVSNGICTVFEKLFGISYTRLKSDKEPNFFLIFIPGGCESYEKDPRERQVLRQRVGEEHDLFVEFLQANGAKVFSMQDLGSIEANMKGSWTYFTSHIKSGTLIIHDSCIRIDQIPSLADAIYYSDLNVWKTSLQPLDEDARSPHLIRLFLRGAIILLTESLMLYRPHEALRILMWFRLVKNHRGRMSDTWKIAVRVHLRPWLLDILDLYEDTKTDIFGCGKQVFAEIYTNVTWLLEAETEFDKDKAWLVPDGMMCYKWDNETPNERAPLVAPSLLHEMRSRKAWKDSSSGSGSQVEIDHQAIKANDDTLIDWFAQYAVFSCSNFRRFQVVLGYAASPSSDNNKFESLAATYRHTYPHLEIVTPEKCFSRQNILPQAELDKKEAERLERNRAQRDEVRARVARTLAKERDAAVLSLERMKAAYRSAGATDKEVREGVRIHLRQAGASLKEIKEVAIDTSGALQNESWARKEFSKWRGLVNDLGWFEEVERMLDDEKVEEERAERMDQERIVQGRERVREWISSKEGEEEGVGVRCVRADGGRDDNDTIDADVDATAMMTMQMDGAAEDRRRRCEDAVARSIRLAREFPL